MKILGWIHYEDVTRDDEEIFGGFGGFFADGMRWNDYLDQFNNLGKDYAEALRDEILKDKIKCTGSQHQNGYLSVPVFSDGTISTFSYRGWGDLMAAVWSEAENKDYNYMDFYM